MLLLNLQISFIVITLFLYVLEWLEMRLGALIDINIQKPQCQCVTLAYLLSFKRPEMTVAITQEYPILALQSVGVPYKGVWV